MKRCKKCKAIIELSQKDFKKGYKDKDLKVVIWKPTYEEGRHKVLCAQCFHKESIKKINKRMGKPCTPSSELKQELEDLQNPSQE